MAPKKPRLQRSRTAPDELSAETLLTALKSGNKPLRLDDFLRVLGLPRKAKKRLDAELGALVENGTLLRLTGGAYAMASRLRQVSGVLHMQRSGVGFVMPDGDRSGDIFIAPHQMRDAWHGDRVLVALLPASRGKSREGLILSVLERNTAELPARVLRRAEEGIWLCEPADPRLSATFLVDASALPANPLRDDLLLIRPGEAKGPGLWEAEAIRNLGSEETVAAQELTVKASHALPVAFPASVLSETGLLPVDPLPEDLQERHDLTALDFVTIDGADAKDFDDAIQVEKKGNGFLLRVAIADVAHYVRPGSALDREALVRGNSYYFPASVEPMLPEALSNGLCSLKPQVLRLVMAAEISFNAKGQPGDAAFFPAFIRSHARLTYDQVFQALIQKDEAARQELAPVLPMLEKAEELARLLAEARDARGSLDFEIPEPQFRLDAAGHVLDIVPRAHNFAHRLIEEFMVAANEAVARFLTAKGVPPLYRSHPAPDPDKLKTLFALLSRSALAAGLPKNPSAGDLQKLLRQSKGTDQEYVVGRLALRSMMQAAYTTDNQGHYGLASDCYCHFTSPIRRYADLVVHRALKAALGTPDAAPLPSPQRLHSVADQINLTERAAMEAEREIQRRLAALFMLDKVGREYSGVISGVTEAGFFVELRGVMVEGMVRLSSLRDDYYVLFQDRQELRGERTGRLFRLGQRVDVAVADVSLPRREVTFTLLDGARETGRRSGGRREGPKQRASGRATGQRSERGPGRDAKRDAAPKRARVKRPKGSTGRRRSGN